MACRVERENKRIKYLRGLGEDELKVYAALFGIQEAQDTTWGGMYRRHFGFESSCLKAAMKSKGMDV